MSYSSDVKNELARLEGQKSCCEKAELLGVLRMSGALVLRGKNIGIQGKSRKKRYRTYIKSRNLSNDRNNV